MLGSTETSKGVFSSAAAAGPPLPLLPFLAAVLTMVEMVPLGVTSRMALLNVSAMKRSPAWSSAMPCGLCRRAWVAGPPSPLNPPRPPDGLVGRHVAGHGGDDPVGGDPADDVVARVGDVEVAQGVDRQPGGERELGPPGGTVVALVAGVPVAGHGGDLAPRGDLAHDVVVGVGDEDVALGVDGHALGVVELGPCGRSRRTRP